MVLLLGLDRHFRQSTTHRRNRSKSPPKGHHHHFTHHQGQDFLHQHHFPSSVRQSRRFSSPQHRDNFIPKYYYSESESDFVPHFHNHATRRSRSSPPARPHHHVTSLHRNNLSGDHFGVFHTHDLHEANARRASRRDLADLREQLFVRSTNDLLSARTGGRAARASGRNLLDQWEASHCEKCNAHTLSHNHRHSHRHSGGSHFHDEIFVPRNGGGRY